MPYSIFYSWQTDAPAEVNRRFIREALDEAVKQIADGSTVEDSPRVESGMEGISGTPEVASVMFNRIDACSLFVADMTLVGTIPATGPGKEAKRVPNPNVLLETGYAAARIGWGRIICVMNEHFGSRQEQPFDVRNRRFPIDYRLDPTTNIKRKAARAQLTKWIRQGIETTSRCECDAVEDAVAQMDARCLSVLVAHGKAESFPHLSAAHANGSAAIAYHNFSGAVERLLALRVLRCDMTGPHQYAYHWTYFGKLVLKRVGIGTT